MTLLRGLAVPTGRRMHVARYAITTLQQPCELVLQLGVAGERSRQRRIGVTRDRTTEVQPAASTRQLLQRGGCSHWPIIFTAGSAAEHNSHRHCHPGNSRSPKSMVASHRVRPQVVGSKSHSNVSNRTGLRNG
jgi:hypothetical protein